MKPSFFKRALIVAVMTLCMTFGALAQAQKQDKNEQSIMDKLRDEWALPSESDSGTGGGGKWGSIHILQFETEKPYIEVVKFYCSRSGLLNDQKFLEKAANFDFAGSGGGSDHVTYSIDNSARSLSMTFVCLYPIYTINVVLSHTKQTPTTRVTISRIDRKSVSVRNDKQDFAVIETVLSDLLAEISRNKTAAAKLVLDKSGYETFRPKNKRIVVGDLKRISEEYEKSEQRPDYMLEFSQTYYREAMAKVFPGCQFWITAERPEYALDGTATIVFRIGPAPHGAGTGIYTLSKQKGAWRVASRSRWYPQ